MQQFKINVSFKQEKIINFLNDFYNLGLSLEELTEFVLQFGTDICFLLHNQKAIVKGIGEIIEPINLDIKQKVLIINPNIKIETKYIYNKVKEISHTLLYKEYIYENDILKILENDLERVVFEEFNEMRKLYNELNDVLDNVHMSGSGSTMYSLIESHQEQLIKDLKNKYPNYLIDIYNVK